MNIPDTETQQALEAAQGDAWKTNSKFAANDPLSPGQPTAYPTTAVAAKQFYISYSDLPLRLNTNACGHMYEFCRIEDATKFDNEEEAARKAVKHGVRHWKVMEV